MKEAALSWRRHRPATGYEDHLGKQMPITPASEKEMLRPQREFWCKTERHCFSTAPAPELNDLEYHCGQQRWLHLFGSCGLKNYQKFQQRPWFAEASWWVEYAREVARFDKETEGPAHHPGLPNRPVTREQRIGDTCQGQYEWSSPCGTDLSWKPWSWRGCTRELCWSPLRDPARPNEPRGRNLPKKGP